MPEQRVFENLFPRTYPWKGSVDQHEAANDTAVLGGERKNDHLSNVVGDEVDLLHPDGVAHGGQVPRLRVFLITAGGLSRQAKTQKYGHNNKMSERSVGGPRRLTTPPFHAIV